MTDRAIRIEELPRAEQELTPAEAEAADGGLLPPFTVSVPKYTITVPKVTYTVSVAGAGDLLQNELDVQK